MRKSPTAFKAAISFTARFPWRSATIVKALLDRGVRKENIPFDDLRARARALAIAGFKSDEADGDDQLDIEKEVEALCMVLAARDIEPPISLGLFGDWGSGKSFFMKKMEDWFKRLKVQNQNGSPYCSNIVQLKFNAWHYSDTNLWASLTSAILQGLAQALSDKDDPDSQYARAGLEAKKEEAQSKLVQAEREKGAAEEDVRASEQRLQQLDTAVPPEHMVREAFRAAVSQPQLASQIHEAAKELGVPQAEAAAANLKNELLQVKSIWDTFALMLRSPRSAQNVAALRGDSLGYLDRRSCSFLGEGLGPGRVDRKRNECARRQRGLDSAGPQSCYARLEACRSGPPIGSGSNR